MNAFLDKLSSLASPAAPPLRLYHMEYCYYCVLVRRAADKLGIKLKLVDVLSDRSARQRLVEATGRSRVPVLGIRGANGDETFLPESEEIIAFLRRQSHGAEKQKNEAVSP
jgi:glutaredoxin